MLLTRCTTRTRAAAALTSLSPGARRSTALTALVTSAQVPQHCFAMSVTAFHASSSSAAAAASSRPATPASAGHVLVLGAGVQGVSVAWQLLRSGLYAGVTLLADKFSPDTTSDVAGASIVPYSDSQDPVEQAKVIRWTKQTSDFLAALRQREGSHVSGVRMAPSYEHFTSPTHPDPWWAEGVHGYRRASTEETEWLLGAEAAAKLQTTWAYTTLMLDVSAYLQSMMREVAAIGGRTQRGSITSLNQLRTAMQLYNDAHSAADSQAALSALDAAATEPASSCCPQLSPEVHSLLRARPYTLVVNCTGLGSKWLVPDPGVVGVKGIVLRVAGVPDAMHHCYSADELSAYILPRHTDATVGGTYGFGDYSTTATEADQKRILERAAIFVSDIKNASSVRLLAGTRPWRSTVRLELVRGQEPRQPYPAPRLVAEPNADYYSRVDATEVARMQAEDDAARARRSEREIEWDERSPKVPVIHAYGHGGSGITLHMGCAEDVLQLAKELLTTNATAATGGPHSAL